MTKTHRLLVTTALLAALAGPAAAQNRSVAQRVQLLEDREAIHSVLERFFEYQESGDRKAYAGLFATGGELILRVGTSRKDAKGDLVPVAPRAAPTTPRPAANAAPRTSRAMRHILSNAYIDVKGDTATVVSRWTMLVGAEDGRSTRVGGTGRYFDDFVRENGQWKIKKRSIDIDIPVETARANSPAGAAPSP